MRRWHKLSEVLGHAKTKWHAHNKADHFHACQASIGAATLSGPESSQYSWTWVSNLTLAGVAATFYGLHVEETLCAAELPLPNANPKADQFVSQFHDWLNSKCNTAAIAVAPSVSTPEAGLAVYVAEEGLREKLEGRWWWTRVASWLSPSDFVLASIPLENVVSSTSIVADEKLGLLYRQLLDAGVVDERQLVMLFLVVERTRGIDSAWHPWLSLLPQAFNTPLFFGGTEMEELAGTTLHTATRVLKSGLRAQWEDLAPAVQQLLRASGPVTQGLSPTFQDFLWAYSIFWSRSITFPEPVACPETKEVLAQPKEGIVPGLDFCNHDPESHFRWSLWNAANAKGGVPKAVSLLTSDVSRVKAGEEVTISYGADRGNEELLHLYGFTIDSNPSDALMIACPIPPPLQRDATFQSRLKILRMRGLSPQLFLPAASLARDTEVVDSMEALGLESSVWEVLEVLTMEGGQVSEAERSIAHLTAEEAMRLKLHVSSQDPVKASARRLAQLATLRMLLEIKCQQLEGEGSSGSLEKDIALLEVDSSLPPLQRSCVVYRASQKRLARGFLEKARRAEALEQGILSAAMEKALPPAPQRPVT